MHLKMLQHVFIACNILHSCPPASDPPQGDIPHELRRMFEYRAQLFNTAEIEWSVEEPGATSYYSSRYAGADSLVVHHGTETGLQNIHSDGEPFAYAEQFRLLKNGQQWEYLEDAGSLFLRDLTMRPYHEREPGPDYPEQTDLRTVGLHFYWRIYSDPRAWTPADYAQWVASNPPSGGWRVDRTPEGLVDVTGYYDESVMVWRLDPQLELQPVLVQLTSRTVEGELRIRQSITTYGRIAGKCFPEQIEFIDSKHGESHREILRIHHAVFDSPELPLELDVNNCLGLMVGVNVLHVSPDGAITQNIWDGENVLALDDFFAKKREGLLDNSAFIARRLALAEEGQGRIHSKPKSDALGFFHAQGIGNQPALWEPYVRRFIIVTYMDSDQTRKAWGLLRECQKPAYEHLEKTKAERAEAEKELAALKVKAAKASPEGASPAHKAAQRKTEGSPAAPSSANSTAGGKPVAEGEVVEGDAPRVDGESRSGQARGAASEEGKRSGSGEAHGLAAEPVSPDVAKLEERVSKLYAPVDAIFEKKLKPGLYDLLTKEQKDVLARRESAVKELNKSGEDVRKP